MATGTVKWFNDAKGFGFITQDGGGEDVFLSQTAISPEGFRTLVEGQKIKFDISKGPKGLQSVKIHSTEEPILTAPVELEEMLKSTPKLRKFFVTLYEKGVLILGRFTVERKEILDAVKSELEKMNYIPVMFDFDPIPGQGYTERIMAIAGLCGFVIADLTDPKSLPQEAQSIIPNFKIPFVSIIQEGDKPWSMFQDMSSYPWVIPEVKAYKTKEGLIKALPQIMAQASELRKALSLTGSSGPVNINSIEQ